MGMSIQEILAAQQRAANATRKNRPEPFRKTGSSPGTRTVKEMLEAQQITANATRKPVSAPAPNPTGNPNVAELIAQQRQIVESQKAASSGLSHLSSEQKHIIDDVKARYNEFIAKLDKELGNQEWKMEPPVTSEAADAPEQFFTPNVPDDLEAVAEKRENMPDVNGISVGDEMGGQVTMPVRMKRRTRMSRRANGGFPPDNE